MMEGSYAEEEVTKLAMPRGSVLIFVGGMVHAGGTNTTEVKRKSFLTGYQLGWLRPENKFFAYKPLHDAVIAGQFSDELATMLGHGAQHGTFVHFLCKNDHFTKTGSGQT